MRNRALPVLFLLAASALPAAAQVAAPPVAVVEAIRETDVRRLLTGLADDSMQGRRTGTPGIRRAAKLIADRTKTRAPLPNAWVGPREKEEAAPVLQTGPR